MSFLDNIPSLLQGPGAEEFLAAIPLLLGSFEEGRGRPMGGVLETLGGLIGQHAQYRRTGQTASAMEKFLQGSIKPGSMAATEYQQFQPIENSFGPDERLAMFQNILGEAQTEAAKKPNQYYNQKTGQIELHDPQEFTGGSLPADLVPLGGEVANALEKKATRPKHRQYQRSP